MCDWYFFGKGQGVISAFWKEQGVTKKGQGAAPCKNPMLPTTVRSNHVIKVTSSVFIITTLCVKPAMSKKRTILSFDQCASCRALAIELWCGKMQIEANRVATKSHRGRVEFRRPAWYEISGAPKVDLRWLQVFAYCTIPQLLYYYDALILGFVWL